MNLNVGQRIMVIKMDSNWSETKLLINKTGTIKTLRDYADEVGIEFDNTIPRGHNCSGTCKTGYGYYINYKCVKLLSINERIR